MNARFHGNPCWYELATRPGHLAAAQAFYARVLGWTFHDTGLPAPGYHQACSDGSAVAGLTQWGDDEAAPAWTTYFAVADIDAFVADARAAGATVQLGPTVIPGTGRFARLADPQGAPFGVLQPDRRATPGADAAGAGHDAGGAFHPNAPGHVNWNELASADPQAGFAFHARVFGWTAAAAVDLGPMGTYQLIACHGVDIGGVMGLCGLPASRWLPYFGVRGSVADAVATVRAAGGQIHHDPMQVPGGAWVASGQDPQGAWFAVTGTQP